MLQLKNLLFPLRSFLRPAWEVSLTQLIFFNFQASPANTSIQVAARFLNILVSNYAILCRGHKTDVLTILQAATHNTERGNHNFCLSQSHNTDTNPTSWEPAATAGFEPTTSSPGVQTLTSSCYHLLEDKSLNYKKNNIQLHQLNKDFQPPHAHTFLFHVAATISGLIRSNLDIDLHEKGMTLVEGRPII